ENIAIYGFKGENTSNPATGKPAAWISRDEKERAQTIGLQVWDTQEILLLHLAHYLKKNAKEFIGIQEVQLMISGLKQHYPTLVEETVPKPVSLQTLTEILRRLVEEEVSVRDLKTILQVLCEWGRVEHEVLALTEHVRAGLRAKICYQISRGRPLLFVYRLDPEFEEMFRNSIRQSAGGAYLAMDPAMSRQVMEAARTEIGDLPPGAQRPVIVTDGEIRRFVKRLLDFAVPDVTVLSYDQLTPQINLQPLGTISPSAQAQIAGGCSRKHFSCQWASRIATKVSRQNGKTPFEAESRIRKQPVRKTLFRNIGGIRRRAIIRLKREPTEQFIRRGRTTVSCANIRDRLVRK